MKIFVDEEAYFAMSNFLDTILKEKGISIIDQIYQIKSSIEVIQNYVFENSNTTENKES